MLERTVEASVINFSWLLRLRWGAVVGQLTTVLAVDQWVGIDLPLPPLLSIIAVTAATNVALAAWSRGRTEVADSVFGSVLTADVFLLTGLFWLTGGPYNPFSFLYLVYIALAAVVLSERWTWALAVLALGSFGALFLLPTPGSAPMHDHAAAAHGDHLRMHLEGMWVAFGVAAGFIVYFVQRVSRALAAREAELRAARETRERNEKLASLVTLAAGAAHELATPLSTIAVVSKELEHRLTATDAADAAVEDARLIRNQVDRCRSILSQMTADAGETMGEGTTRVPLRVLLDAAVERSSEPQRVEVRMQRDVETVAVRGPREALERAVAHVVDNGLQASAGGAPVVIEVGRDGRGIRIHVRDEGCGIAAEDLRRVGEPFFTTKPPGEGMGLGLYLTRGLLGRMGGQLRIRSEEGRGTRVVLHLPGACLDTNLPLEELR